MIDRLRQLVLEQAFRYSPTAEFKLVHGGTSHYYFNCKQVTLDPEGQYLIGNLIFDLVADLDVTGIGGLTLGADPIANAVSYTSWTRGRPIQSFVVRKTVKDHGTRSPIEGKVRPGDRVVVVDDVVTTGGSTLQAIEACKRFGLEVARVVVLVDRQELNGRQNILAEAPDMLALVTREQIMEMYMKTSL